MPRAAPLEFGSFLGFGAWDLELLWNLELGAWNLVLPVSLELGVWSFSVNLSP
jgi:hypothetical protein